MAPTTDDDPTTSRVYDPPEEPKIDAPPDFTARLEAQMEAAGLPCWSISRETDWAGSIVFWRIRAGDKARPAKFCGEGATPDDALRDLVDEITPPEPTIEIKFQGKPISALDRDEIEEALSQALQHIANTQGLKQIEYISRKSGEWFVVGGFDPDFLTGSKGEVVLTSTKRSPQDFEDGQ